MRTERSVADKEQRMRGRDVGGVRGEFSPRETLSHVMIRDPTSMEDPHGIFVSNLVQPK
jgi:hypothetical protein